MKRQTAHATVAVAGVVVVVDVVVVDATLPNDYHLCGSLDMERKFQYLSNFEFCPPPYPDSPHPFQAMLLMDDGVGAGATATATNAVAPIVDATVALATAIVAPPRGSTPALLYPGQPSRCKPQARAHTTMPQTSPGLCMWRMCTRHCINVIQWVPPRLQQRFINR
jgi:hypothetical protein